MAAKKGSKSRKTDVPGVMGIMGKSERDWQAEDDVRTLQRAHEIRKDKARFKRAQAKAKEMLAALQAAAE